MASPSNHSPPFSPVGSFVPREEFQRSETRQSAVASLTLSGTGGIRVTGVQQEVSTSKDGTIGDGGGQGC